MHKAPLCASVLLALCGIADAAQQSFPARPVRMIVSNTPGSAPDVVARLVSAKLTEAWGQQIVIDNRPGATGLIAAETLARAAPDGYTLWLNTMTQLISTLQAQRHMLAKDFAPVSLVASTPFVIVVGSSLPVKTPRPIIAKINADLIHALKNPELQERLFNVGAEAVGSTPEALGTFLQKETERWDKVLREGGTIPPGKG